MAGLAEDIADGTDVGGPGIDAESLKRLARLVEENGLSELRVEEGNLRVTLRTASYRAAFGPVAAVGVATPAATGEIFPGGDVISESGVPALSAPAVPAENLLRIEAPIMGVFYRTSAPGEPPFVEVGDLVEVGQPVGVIEAMKVFSEVLADRGGLVREIPALNGGLVQPGEPLIILEAV